MRWRHALVGALLSMGLEFEMNGTSVMAQPAPYEKPVPSYARWAKVALDQTSKTYPKSSVVDFEHVGRRSQSDTVAQEVFKLWVIDQGRERGFYVIVSFNAQNNTLIRVQFNPTSR